MSLTLMSGQGTEEEGAQRCLECSRPGTFPLSPRPPMQEGFAGLGSGLGSDLAPVGPAPCVPPGAPVPQRAHRQGQSLEGGISRQD